MGEMFNVKGLLFAIKRRREYLAVVERGVLIGLNGEPRYTHVQRVLKFSRGS